MALKVSRGPAYLGGFASFNNSRLAPLLAHLQHGSREVCEKIVRGGRRRFVGCRPLEAHEQIVQEALSYAHDSTVDLTPYPTFHLGLSSFLRLEDRPSVTRQREKACPNTTREMGYITSGHQGLC